MLAIAPVPQRAQEICAPPSRDCFTRPPRDIAFIVDRSGSIALRGQTYNAAIDGVIRSIADETVIPRDGSVAITVVVFNDAATTVLPLTEISSAAAAESIISTLALLKCGVIGSQTFPCPFGATSFTAAIQAADIALARGRNENPKPGVERVFLMATDGNSDDPDGGAAAAEAARNAATILGIPVELDVILMGVAPDASDFAGRKANADLIVFPKPTDNLPGATFVINPGECNVDGAGAGGTDCNRQANEFAELARRIVLGPVMPLSLVVTTEADSAPGAPPATGELSLRQAIELANCNGGAATITFAPELNDETILLDSALPQLAWPDIIIDGCVAPDDDPQGCQPGVTIDGQNKIADGLWIRSNRDTVRGIRLINFTRAAVTIAPACPNDTVGHNRVEQNALEDNPTGVLVLDSLDGRMVRSNLRNLISRNTITRLVPDEDDPPAALIDLDGDGPTPNDDGDEDEGPNTLLNFTDSLSVVTGEGDTVTVTGKLNSPPAAGAKVELFAVTVFRIVDESIVIDGVSFLAQADVGDNGEFTAADIPASPTGIYTATVIDRPAIDNVADRSANTSEIMFDSEETKLPRPDAETTSPLAFGNVPLNAPTTRMVEVMNTGTAPLSFDGCVIRRCSDTDPDQSARFTLSGCPTGPIDPGETATINVTVNPNACGAVRACLILATNDPFEPEITIELTGNATAPASAVIQGNVTELRFKRVRARGTPRGNPETQTFTIANAGCSTLELRSATLERVTGNQRRADNSGVFMVTTSSGSSLPVNVAPGGTVVIRVSFNPVIPAVIPEGTQPAVRDLLPDEVNDVLTIQTNTTQQVSIALVGRVKKKVRLIDPADPSAAPVVTLCRSGDEFTVRFAAYDSNRNVMRATYQFLDSAGRAVGSSFTINNLEQNIAERGIARGQSFTITQRFTGASDNPRVRTVRVTVFDDESSATATSGAVGSACSGTAAARQRR
jgi:hypothetical protein